MTAKLVKLVVDESMIRQDAEETEGEKEQAPEESGAIRAEEEPEEDEKKVRFNPEKHILIEEAKKIKKGVKTGEELEFPLEAHEDFGRIAAQTAKQVVLQRIREAEREATYSEFKNKEHEIVSATVQRVEGRLVFIDIGRTIGILPPQEQVPSERYRIGDRFRVYVISVEKSPRGPGIVVSRAHPDMIKKLFGLEVPEIASGSVEIKAIAREAGSRSKIAVASHEEGVDPVGSCVGQKGTRVTTVIHELGGEKIDVIEWSEDQETFIAHALSPAKVEEVTINAGKREALVTVSPDQLSLAIGRRGQNVRLAAKLTGWRIDVRSMAASVSASASPDDSEMDASEEESGSEEIIISEEKTTKTPEVKKAKKKKESSEEKEKTPKNEGDRAH